MSSIDVLVKRGNENFEILLKSKKSKAMELNSLLINMNYQSWLRDMMPDRMSFSHRKTCIGMHLAFNDCSYVYTVIERVDHATSSTY